VEKERMHMEKNKTRGGYRGTRRGVIRKGGDKKEG
jgi:hypothetical protein